MAVARAALSAAALVAGCQREHLVQPGTGPTAQAAPPLANEDIAAVYATRHVSLTGGPTTYSDIQEARAHPLRAPNRLMWRPPWS
jgi:hypothetical protein